MSHAGMREIAHVARAAGDLLDRVAPRHGSTDDVELHPRSVVVRHGTRIAVRAAEDRLHDLLIPRAATEIPAQLVENLLPRRCPVLGQERAGGHQHAGGAEAALHRAPIDERLLQRRELFRLLQALDGCHLAAVDFDRQVRARTHGVAVDEHRACAAHLHVAGSLGAFETEPVAQHVEQERLGRHRQRHGAAVHAEADVKRRRHGRSRAGARGRARARPRRRARGA